MSANVAKKTLCLIFRKRCRFFSMERIFDQLEPLLAEGMEIQKWQAPYSEPRKARSNWRSIRDVRADVFHITGEIHYMAFALKKRPTVLTIHDIGFLYGVSPLKRRALQWLFLDMPVRRATLVTTISEKTREDVLRVTGCPPDKVITIPNPVNNKIYRQERPVRKDEPVILFVGTTPNKNLERVIPSLENISCRLTIIGKVTPEITILLKKHSIRHELKADLTDDGIAAEYAASDLVLFPSLLEGFGLPVIEGQKAGRPVITSDLSPMKDVAGGAACLVDPYDVRSIREGVLKVLNDESYRNDLVKKGLSNVQRFEPEPIARLYLDCYKKVLAVQAQPH